MNNWFKRNRTHLLIAAVFIVVCFAYFMPAFQGKTLGQVDVIGAQSTQKEINDYRAKDTTILWTNQIFGGMPAYQIWQAWPSSIASHIVNVLTTVLPNPLYVVFLLMFGTYFLFVVLRLNPWLAAAGALAFTFSSYNMILLVAGHSNQILAIAFFAPIIASVLLTLRGKYLVGGSLTALFMAMEFKANHIQMTYYLLIALIILVGIELYHAVRKKTTVSFFKSVAVLAVATLLGVMVNASLLWTTQEYSADSYRGQSNLTQHSKEPSNGLTREYAYQWSQGVGECFTFLVPNAYGGQTGPEGIDQNSSVAKVFLNKGVPQDQAVTYAQQISSIPGLGMYWGNKPSTSGPFYFGAVICFLFLFGLLIVKNRIKWWLLATVVLTMLLSFGQNWPYVSDLFFNYFPLYNKFRTIESILAVASLCFPILAFLAVQEIIAATDKKAILKKLLLAFYITGGLLLILIVIPTVFLNFRSSEAQTGINYLTQALKGDSGTANAIANAAVNDRTDLERLDAIRSLVFVVLAFGLIWAFIKQKANLTIFSAGLLILVLVDMWQIDKRYLKEASFQEKTDAAQEIKPREVDNFINRDPDPDFRVFDYTDYAGIKQDNFNPFFHKSISGYSAARLKRYDELIDNQLTQNPPNHDVLDMLNTKYIITQDTAHNPQMLRNETACGHAWFVKSVKFAQNADAEMQAISSFAPKDEAIVDQRYKSMIDPNAKFGGDPNATITLVHYNPDDMIYQSGSTASQIAVFSEIYYNKGWKMYIDGEEKPYFRADYVLRAAVIPVGNHKIEFKFHPASYYTGEKIALAGSVLLVLALGGAVYTETRKKKPAVVEEPQPKKK